MTSPDFITIYFTINIDPTHSEGSLDFSQLIGKDVTYYTDNGFKVYNLDSLYEGNRLYILNLDIENNTISGEFNFRIIRNIISTTVIRGTLNITGGRFDVVYQPD